MWRIAGANSANDPLTPDAPVIVWSSGVTDNTPLIEVTPDASLYYDAGDIDPGVDEDEFELQYADNVNFTSATTVSNTIDAIERAANEIDLPTGALSDDTYWIRVRHNHKAAGVDHWSGWSNVETKTIDTMGPTIQSLSPTDNATGVAVASNLVATFNENIAFGTGTIDLYDSDDDLIESFDVETDVGTGNGQVSISGAVLTINPTASMESEKGHYVQIDATAIDDAAGNSFAGISNTTTWNFTTADITAPIVAALTPTDNATDVAVDVGTLVVEFSENIAFGSTVDIGLYLADDTLVEAWDETDIGSTISISGDTLTITLGDDLDPGEDFYVQITAGSIEDSSGNAFAGITNETSWTFTSAASSTPPDLVWRAAGVTSGSGSSRTVSGISVGDAYSTRRVIVVKSAINPGSVTFNSATFDGTNIAATLHRSTHLATLAARDIYVFSAIVPSGTTTDFTINYSGIFQESRYAVFTVDDDLLNNAAPTIDYSEIASGVSDISGDIAVDDDGILIIVTQFDAVRTNPTASGDVAVTKDTANLDGFFNTWHTDGLTADADLDMTVSWTGGDTGACLLLLTWR